MKKSDRLLLLAISVVFVLSLLIRSFTLMESLWLDELHTSWVVSADLSEVAGRAAEGNQAVLYYYVVWIVTAAVGHHEFSLRLISWLAGSLAVVGLMRLLHHWTRSLSLALLVGLLASFDSHFIFFARDARPYALVQLFTVLHLAVTDRQYRCLANQQKLSWVTSCQWLTLTWLLFYTHYTSLLLLPAELLGCWLAIASHQRRRLLAIWTCGLFIVGLGCLPAVPHMMVVFQRRDNWRAFIDVEPWQRILTIFPTGLYVVGPVLVVAIFFVWQRFFGGSASQRQSSPQSDHADRDPATRTSRTCLLVATFLVPLVLAWLATYRNDRFAGIAPLFFRRYIIVASIPLVAFAGWVGVLLDSERRRGLFCIAVLIVAVCQAARRPLSQWSVHSREDWPAALRIIDRKKDLSAWPIVLRAGLIEDDQLGPDASEDLRNYCKFPLRAMYQSSASERPVIVLPSRRLALVNDLTESSLDTLRVTPGVWVLSRGADQKSDVFVRQLEVIVQKIGRSVDVRQHDRAAGLSVVRLRLGPSEQPADD